MASAYQAAIAMTRESRSSSPRRIPVATPSVPQDEQPTSTNEFRELAEDDPACLSVSGKAKLFGEQITAVSPRGARPSDAIPRPEAASSSTTAPAATSVVTSGTTSAAQQPELYSIATPVESATPHNAERSRAPTPRQIELEQAREDKALAEAAKIAAEEETKALKLQHAILIQQMQELQAQLVEVQRQQTLQMNVGGSAENQAATAESSEQAEEAAHHSDAESSSLSHRPLVI